MHKNIVNIWKHIRMRKKNNPFYTKLRTRVCEISDSSVSVLEFYTVSYIQI